MAEATGEPRVDVTFADGTVQNIAVPAGLTLMEALRLAQDDAVLALCGGNCSCGTCHVLIGPDFLDALPDMQIDEEEMLEAVEERCANSRLACQLRGEVLPTGLRVTIPPRDD